jgi:hypothetical protein
MKAKGSFRERLPLVLSITALLVALAGFTPLGEAARNAVPIALFAKNAGKVNGLKASRTPKAGQLVALGADGKFPDSVGQAGPRGPEGPQGPAGDPATKLFAVVNADGSVYKQSGVIGVSKVGTGTYDITFNRNVDDCAPVASAGGHKLTDTTWTDNGPDPGIGTAATFGSVVQVRTLASNGFHDWQLKDWNFQVAVFC